jgi:hypothetical protein
MDSTERIKSNSDENNVIIEEVVQQKDHSIKKTFSTLKEENDKLRTYLGLVKMCNYSAIAKIKSALNETNNAINSLDIDCNVIVKQLEIIESEITNMQSMHSKLEEGIESFQVIETNTNCNQINSNTNEESNDQNRDTVVLVTTRYEVPRKSTGIRKSHSPRNQKSKSKATKESSFNAKLLNRIVETKGPKPVPNAQPLQTTVVCNEQQEAVASIDNTSSCEERENENVSEGNDVNELVRVKTTKRPYISEEFKTSHFQRLVEAKKRREEMNKQLEREGKRKPKIKRTEDQLKELGDSPKKSPKKRQTKKKIVGKVTTRKTIKSQPITTAQSIVVPINQSTLDSLSGQTIQIIASGGTQILCRNDGTFIPASNNSWQTANTQWTTTTDNNYSQNQWSQYQT